MQILTLSLTIGDMPAIEVPDDTEYLAMLTID